VWQRMHHRPQIAAGQRKAAEHHDKQDNYTDNREHVVTGP
jgi:hypothetical protein